MISQNEDKIIVSADDFGISKIATGRILELVDLGKIDRVEVMISQNITKEQAERLIHSGIKIDIHFHLDFERIDKWQLRQEEEKESDLKRIFNFLREYFFSKHKIDETEAEWCFQMSDFKKLFGRYPDGLSSHEHIHFFPAYFKLIIKIAREYNINHVRLGRRNFNDSNLVSIILNWLRKIDVKYLKKYNLETTYYFISFDWIKGKKNPLLKVPKEKQVELVFHPERDDEWDFLKAII